MKKNKRLSFFSWGLEKFVKFWRTLKKINDFHFSAEVWTRFGDCGVFEEIPRERFFPTLQDALILTQPRSTPSMSINSEKSKWGNHRYLWYHRRLWGNHCKGVKRKYFQSFPSKILTETNSLTHIDKKTYFIKTH